MNENFTRIEVAIGLIDALWYIFFFPLRILIRKSYPWQMHSACFTKRKDYSSARALRKIAPYIFGMNGEKSRDARALFAWHDKILLLTETSVCSVLKAAHRTSWGRRAAGTRRVSWVASATSCWTRTSPSPCRRPRRRPTRTRASPERKISVPSDVRWCCRVHPEARIWKNLRITNHTHTHTHTEHTAARCCRGCRVLHTKVHLCLSCDRVLICARARGVHHFCTDSSLHRWNSRDERKKKRGSSGSTNRPTSSCAAIEW